MCLGVPGVADSVRLFLFFQTREAQKRKKAELALLEADPFDPEAQARIASMIKEENVNESFHNAMENSPELFGNVIMLYVNMGVNGVPLKAFVDSG